MSDAYTYNVGEFRTGDESPQAPNGAPVNGAGAVLNFNSGGDTTPPAPGPADGIEPFAGMPDSSGDTMPKPPIVDGATMPINAGKARQSL